MNLGICLCMWLDCLVSGMRYSDKSTVNTSLFSRTPTGVLQHTGNTGNVIFILVLLPPGSASLDCFMYIGGSVRGPCSLSILQPRSDQGFVCY